MGANLGAITNSVANQTPLVAGQQQTSNQPISQQGTTNPDGSYTYQVNPNNVDAGLANDLPPINQQNPYGTAAPTMQGIMGGGQLGTAQTQASGADPISGLYQSILGRAPDAAGLQYWQQQLANGTPLSSIQQQFQNTPEAQTRTSQLAPAQNSNINTTNDPITGLYQSVLGRTPDAGGLQYWQSQLASGKSLQDIQSQMMQSPEYQQRFTNPVNKSTQANTNPYGITTSNPYSGSTNPYIQASQQTALGNLAGAQTATAANRVNQQTPYANLNYVQTGVDAQGNPIWSAQQTLAGPLAGAQSSLAQGVANQSSQGFNPNTPSVGINPGETYSDAIMRRLQPQQQQQSSALETRLANQGIMPGSEAYNRARTQLSQSQNDALTSAQVGGIGVGLQANQQSFNQQLQQANLPYQQLGAFNQATQPGYVNPYTQAATTGPDYTGSYATSNAAAIAQQNANNAKTANLQSGLFGLGSAALLGGGGLTGLASLGNSAYNTLFGNNGLNNPLVSSTDYMSNIGATSSGAFDPTMSSSDYLTKLYGTNIF